MARLIVALMLILGITNVTASELPVHIEAELADLTIDERSVVSVLVNFYAFQRLNEIVSDPTNDVGWAYKVAQAINSFVAILASHDNPDMASIAEDRAKNFLARIRGEASNAEFVDREAAIVAKYRRLQLHERALRNGASLPPERQALLDAVAQRVGDYLVLDAMRYVAAK